VNITTKSSKHHYIKIVSIVADYFTTKFLQCTDAYPKQTTLNHKEHSSTFKILLMKAPNLLWIFSPLLIYILLVVCKLGQNCHFYSLELGRAVYIVFIKLACILEVFKLLIISLYC